MMLHRRPLLPVHGNPMRPIFIFIAVSLGAMLVGFPLMMLMLGLGIGSAIAIALLIGVTTIFLLAILRWMADQYEDDRQALLAGETLAAWRLSPDEHRRFLAGERRSTRRMAVAAVLFGSVLGVVLGVVEDWLLGGIMIGAFLFAATVILLSGPSRSAATDAGSEVLIGTRGVQVLDRYVPFHAPMTRLRNVELRPGDPAVLLLTVRTGRRLEHVRVPVPRDRLAEAEALVGRPWR